MLVLAPSISCGLVADLRHGFESSLKSDHSGEVATRWYQVCKAIGGLAQIIECQTHVGIASESATPGCTFQQWKMSPPSFKGTTDSMEAEA